MIHSERNVGPKWPFHQGPRDTVEAYLKRTDWFGMLGIAKDGQNPTRNKVQKALKEQQVKANAKNYLNSVGYSRNALAHARLRDCRIYLPTIWIQANSKWFLPYVI